MGNVDPQVVVLSGSRSEMGFKYGNLMQDRLRSAYDILFNYYVLKMNIPEEVVASKAEVFFQKYPLSYQKFIESMAEGAGITLTQAKILNGMETLNSLVKVKKTEAGSATAETIKSSEVSGCAFLAIPADKTDTGGNLIGRNYDFFPPFDQMAKFLTITVLHEMDHVPTAFISFVGQIYCPTCINSAGLFVEFNNGMPSGGFKTDNSVESLLINLLETAQESLTFNQFDTLTSALRADYSLVVNAANRTHTKAFEFSAGTGTLKEKNYTETAIVASTNSFSHPDWTSQPTDEQCWSGHSRREGLIAHANLRSAHSVSDLKNIMNIDLTQGGGSWEYTLYQLIYDTANNMLYVRPKVVSDDWCSINLNQLFDPEFNVQSVGVIVEGACSVNM